MEEQVLIRKYFLKFAGPSEGFEVPRERWIEEAIASGFMTLLGKEPPSWASDVLYGYTVISYTDPLNVPKDDLDKTLEAFLAKGSL